MIRDELSVLSVFLTVAEERSFTRAATRLRLSRYALSRAINGLEGRLGVRLLARTTRSVAPTDAGLHFIARLGPALSEICDAWNDVAGLGEASVTLTCRRSAMANPTETDARVAIAQFSRRNGLPRAHRQRTLQSRQR